MNIYISGSWNERARLRPHAETLRARGHRVISSWLDEQDRPAHLSPQEWHRRLALKDTAEVVSSEVLILDVMGTSTTGGRYVEWGIACHPQAMIKRVIVGPLPETDIFGQLADYRFADWAALLASPLFQGGRNAAD